MVDRRHITLILLRPDGANRTWQLTPRRITGLVVAAVVVVVVAAGLIFWSLWSRRQYRELAERYELLAGREVLALSPRPSPADLVPGAAAFPEEEGGGPGSARPSAVPLEGPAMVPGGSGALEPAPAPEPERGREAPVRLENFRIRQVEEGVWEIGVELAKSELDGQVLRGFTAVLLEDLSRSGEYLTQPPMTLREGRPITPQAGESFAIRRFKPLRYRFELPEGFRIGSVRFVVYDRSGALLLERVFEIEGTS